MTFAQSATDGCYVVAPTQVNEGVIIPVSIDCANIPTTNRVFGFQFGTSLTTGSFVAPTPGVYAPGTFVDDADGDVYVGENTLGLYGVSRQLGDIVDAEDFTLGSLAVTAVTNLTTVDVSVAVTFNDTTFKLSNDLGAALSGWLRTVNDSSTTVNDIDLAWLSGDVTVKSDSTALDQIDNVTLNVGGKIYTAPTVAFPTTDFTMTSSSPYIETALGVAENVLVNANAGALQTFYAAANNSDDTLDIAVTADMWGHKACSTTGIDLLDAGAAEEVNSFVGTAGVITLLAGDANKDGDITNSDAVAIGLDFGDSDALINNTTENDINLDQTVDILDLVHVGRNYESAPVVSTCS